MEISGSHYSTFYSECQAGKPEAGLLCLTDFCLSRMALSLAHFWSLGGGGVWVWEIAHFGVEVG